MVAVVLDVDTGVDDALAVLVAARHPALELRGVVCTAGNAGLADVVRNTGYLLEVAGRRDVPVVRGAAATLDGRGPRPASRHGPDGLAGLAPAAPGRPADPRTAAQLLRDVLPGAWLVLLGPQTSCAAALRADPNVLRGCSGVVAAAGSSSGGPEFNADHDRLARTEVSEAARRTGLVLREVPVEIGRATRPPPPSATAPPDALDALVRDLLAANGGEAGDAAVLATLLPPWSASPIAGGWHSG